MIILILMEDIHFTLGTLPTQSNALRTQVRNFLAEYLSDYPSAKRAQSWSGSDRAFSKLMGANGFIGMTWPKKYGGGERSALERYVMLEEMLAAGAPVAAHWHLLLDASLPSLGSLTPHPAYSDWHAIPNRTA